MQNWNVTWIDRRLALYLSFLLSLFRKIEECEYSYCVILPNTTVESLNFIRISWNQIKYFDCTKRNTRDEEKRRAKSLEVIFDVSNVTEFRGFLEMSAPNTHKRNENGPKSTAMKAVVVQADQKRKIHWQILRDFGTAIQLLESFVITVIFRNVFKCPSFYVLLYQMKLKPLS